MKFVAFYAISAIIIGSVISFELSSLEDRIVSGRNATRGQFPYMASLRRVKRENGTIKHDFRCGASIISDRWAISGADCTWGPYSKPADMVIVGGAHHRSKDGRIFRLDRIVNHPTFDWKNDRGDISLLRTVNKIQFGRTVQAIPLRKQFVGEGVSAIVSGWGRKQTSGWDFLPEYLQYLRVKTLTNEKCLARYHDVYPDYIYDGTLCTYAGQRQGTCSGDFGGPLVANGQLIGVSSWAWPCAFARPDGFTRISVFTEWIEEISGVAAV